MMISEARIVGDWDDIENIEEDIKNYLLWKNDTTDQQLSRLNEDIEEILNNSMDEACQIDEKNTKSKDELEITQPARKHLEVAKKSFINGGLWKARRIRHSANLTINFQYPDKGNIKNTWVVEHTVLDLITKTAYEKNSSKSESVLNWYIMIGCGIGGHIS
ncbi:2768_t:CDS:2 [Entrophospora sp. SA101]|nr:2768_t:CDS:2 [Entrophospora sp. SA101]